MRRAILVALGTGAVITSAAAIGVGAALSPSEESMSREQYDAARQRLQSFRTLAQAHCESLEPAQSVTCLAQVRADHRVRMADLEVAFRHSEPAARDAQRARIDARYEVDRAGCESVRGLRKDRCLVAAHAAKGRALLEAAAPYGLRYNN
jgi:hypothetical protein